MKKSESVLKKVIIRILKKPSTLLILAVLLSCNVFAWFIYTTKVDSTITARVKAWNVDFQVGSTPLSQEINFDIPEIYPGMTTYESTVTATNNGESSAVFSYEIVSATILGETYTVSPLLTSSELLDNLENNYPFSVLFNVNNTVMMGNGGTGDFNLQVVWPYESGDDEADTLWGKNAYTYHLANPDSPSISLVMKISAVQVTE